ncbi:hypothetical protein F2Q68_00045336 [Brassica cretica]|uniref:Uncharacterized protein n=1 Tax=Brassica cretica TaxID=69181 RepID=A0A8S9LT47_BRACR|nr:hypothetical protein F2Q68_00045336 [Brassica cretica]
MTSHVPKPPREPTEDMVKNLKVDPLAKVAASSTSMHEIHSEWRRGVAVDESVEKQAGVNLCLRGDYHYLEHGDER